MTAAEERQLKEYALKAVSGETEEERLYAASILLHAAIKAIKEVEDLRASRRHLRVVGGSDGAA